MGSALEIMIDEMENGVRTVRGGDLVIAFVDTVFPYWTDSKIPRGASFSCTAPLVV